MQLEANSVEPGAVHLIITRHAYTKSYRRSRGSVEMELFTYLDVWGLSPVRNIQGPCLAQSLETR